MAKLRRYTKEEDNKILRDWWDPEKREGLTQELDRTHASLNFRYYSLLKRLGIDPGEHRLNQGVIDPERAESKKDNDSQELIDSIEDLSNRLGSLEEIIGESMESVEKLSEIYTMFSGQVNKNNQLYRELDFWLGQFFKLNNIEKLTTLNDFLPKLKEIVQKTTGAGENESREKQALTLDDLLGV